MPCGNKCVLTAQEKNGSPLQNNNLIFKNLAFGTPLQNNKLIFKNLVICTLSRNKKFDLRISAELGEKNKTRG